jgi:V8-like Glu-specific endopeptidase
MNLEEAPYPFHLPIARDLHKRLVDVFSDPGDAQTLVRGAKSPNPAKIDWKQDVDAVWRQVLTRASAEGALRNLLTYIVAESAMPAATKDFVQTLLSNAEPAVDTGAARAQGQPVVVGATKEEALLFGDDLTESVGEIPGLLASIEKVMASAGAVCKLHVLATDGGDYVGTGTLLPSNRILTNHHVLHPDGNLGTKVTAEFGFELDGKGQAVPSVHVDCDVASVTPDKADDWATIALAGAPPATATPLDLGNTHAIASPGERAFIIQHPAGRAKRLGFVRNKISNVEARRIFYLTDTEGGSSGSLVFNGDGKVVGLHRAGGIPQKFTGMSPIKKNEGVRIDVILAKVLA